jgi:hypothetical protein
LIEQLDARRASSPMSAPSADGQEAELCSDVTLLRAASMSARADPLSGSSTVDVALIRRPVRSRC